MNKKLFTRLFSTAYGSESTIYALASGGVRCGIAVIRVSGTQSPKVMEQIGQFKQLPEPRKAVLRTFYDPRQTTSNRILDRGMVIWYPKPRSYTGEDTCEFLVHGGPAVVSSFLRTIGSFKGCRMAEAGEFTKRAFLNGKIRNLTEIDGLHDLITAETEMQRVQALQQMCGTLGELYTSWKNRLTKCLANVEALIDFGEDQSIDQSIIDNVSKEVRILTDEIKRHLQDQHKGERLRNGVTICILGRPNAGKSSLLNILCKREAAITSDVPGTTRDIIETTVNLQGYPVIFADTAGIRPTTDTIESEGIRRALSQAMRSDIVILVIEFRDLKDFAIISRESLIREHISLDASSISVDDLISKSYLILNKADLFAKEEKLHISTDVFDSVISCRTHEGIDALVEKLSIQVTNLCANPKSEAPYITQERYRENLAYCAVHLESYIYSSTTDLALQANYLKNAINFIGRITGEVRTDEILDIIFRDFCIGK